MSQDSTPNDPNMTPVDSQKSMTMEDNIIKATPVGEHANDPEIPGAPRIVGEFDAQQSGKIRERQIARSNMMGLILIGLCVLFFAITIVKIGVYG